MKYNLDHTVTSSASPVSLGTSGYMSGCERHQFHNSGEGTAAITGTVNGEEWDEDISVGPGETRRINLWGATEFFAAASGGGVSVGVCGKE